MSLMEQGARLFFRGLSEEIEPAIEDLRDLSEQMEPALREFAQTMGPALKELMEKVGDINMYHPPEMLPNGDIILRRKDDPLPPPEPPAESAPGEVEL
ncbi:hypothetical protein SAMN04488092_10554 [Thalassovita taeanensis]|uniref:Uncharacterized protein n=2 Tax=Thalassovita taeanensis TaxID=657014 RepID=A0A1H9EHB7_9RHOB|nr:hypothetical protein SAMN04488092_10554 [Thalassovita taeanensis]